MAASWGPGSSAHSTNPPPPSATPLQGQKEEGAAKWCRLEARAFRGTWGPKWSCPSAARCTGGHTSSSVGSGSAQPGSTQYCGSALAFRDLLFSTTLAFCIQMELTVGRMKKQNNKRKPTIRPNSFSVGPTQKLHWSSRRLAVSGGSAWGCLGRCLEGESLCPWKFLRGGLGSTTSKPGGFWG